MVAEEELPGPSPDPTTAVNQGLSQRDPSPEIEEADSHRHSEKGAEDQGDTGWELTWSTLCASQRLHPPQGSPET